MGTVAQRSSKVLLDKIKLSSKNMNKTFINLCQHFTQGLGWSSKNTHKKNSMLVCKTTTCATSGLAAKIHQMRRTITVAGV